MDKNQKELISTYFRKRNIVTDERPYERTRSEFDYIMSHRDVFDIENMFFSYHSIVNDLIKHPEDIKDYNFQKNDSRLMPYAKEILKYLPKLIHYLDLEKITEYIFIEALSYRPGLVEIIPEDKKKMIEMHSDFPRLIVDQPKLGYFFDLSSITSERYIKAIIKKMPQLSNKLVISHLNWYDIYELVRDNPELTNYLDFSHISDDDMKSILSESPILYYIATSPGNKLKSKLSIVSDYKIGSLIIDYPDVIKYLDKNLVNDLHSVIKYNILMKHPELAKDIDASNMFSEAIKELIITHPKIIYNLKYDFSNLYSFDIKDIIISHPELFDYIYDKLKDKPFNRIDILSSRELQDIVEKQPLLEPKLRLLIKNKSFNQYG